MFKIHDYSIISQDGISFVVKYKGYEISLNKKHCVLLDNELSIDIEYALKKQLIGLVSESDMRSEIYLSFEVTNKNIDIWELL